ncbi:Pentachlorophenol 4-monooxygenase [compost metagenome]|jgi:2-polyprenyl-6-methoxyphenol hydroxylase-like FAD-dependent oxidoreductase|uniref:FAD-dependent monooxygenase n=1 Tax=Pseudomonas putida TaxID=303 RepID=UPI000FA9FCBF|nr:FAD-dependent monooxygenase [Pseudomonas putida]
MSHSEHTTTAVLIVGAGPVGLLLGIQLQRFGIPHRLIDKRLQRQPFSKAFAIHSRTLEIFEDLGLLGALLERAVQVEQMHIYSKRKRLISYDLGQLQVPFPFTASIAQNTVEDLLEAHYQQAGGHVERGVELLSLEQNEQAVSVTLKGIDADLEQVQCDRLAGCDGGQSDVRQLTGITFDGGIYPQPYIIADGTLAWRGDNSSGHVFTSGDGYLMLFPLPGGKHRVVINCQDPTLTSADLTCEKVNASLQQRGFGDISLSDPVWLSVTTFQHRLASDYSVGRVFLAGDACHVHSPIGGQGLNTGFQDAYNLSWKLAHTLNYGARQALLDSYQAERRPVAQTVLKNTSQQMRMLNVKRPLLRFLRDAVVPKLARTARFQARIVNQATGFQIDYHTSALSVPASTPGTSPLKAGQRMPDALLRDKAGNALRIFDLLQGTHYSLFVFTGPAADSKNQLDSIKRALETSNWPKDFLRTYLMGAPNLTTATAARGLATRYDLTDTLRETLGVEHGRLLLVRPDGYLALHCPLAEVEQLHRYFALFYPTRRTPTYAGEALAALEASE